MKRLKKNGKVKEEEHKIIKNNYIQNVWEVGGSVDLYDIILSSLRWCQSPSFISKCIKLHNNKPQGPYTIQTNLSVLNFE